MIPQLSRFEKRARGSTLLTATIPDMSMAHPSMNPNAQTESLTVNGIEFKRGDLIQFRVRMYGKLWCKGTIRTLYKSGHADVDQVYPKLQPKGSLVYGPWNVDLRECKKL